MEGVVIFECTILKNDTEMNYPDTILCFEL